MQIRSGLQSAVETSTSWTSQTKEPEKKELLPGTVVIDPPSATPIRTQLEEDLSNAFFRVIPDNKGAYSIWTSEHFFLGRLILSDDEQARLQQLDPANPMKTKGVTTGNWVLLFPDTTEGHTEVRAFRDEVSNLCATYLAGVNEVKVDPETLSEIVKPQPKATLAQQLPALLGRYGRRTVTAAMAGALLLTGTVVNHGINVHNQAVVAVLNNKIDSAARRGVIGARDVDEWTEGVHQLWLPSIKRPATVSFNKAWTVASTVAPDDSQLSLIQKDVVARSEEVDDKLSNLVNSELAHASTEGDKYGAFEDKETAAILQTTQVSLEREHPVEIRHAQDLKALQRVEDGLAVASHELYESRDEIVLSGDDAKSTVDDMLDEVQGIRDRNLQLKGLAYIDQAINAREANALDMRYGNRDEQTGSKGWVLLGAAARPIAGRSLTANGFGLSESIYPKAVKGTYTAAEVMEWGKTIARMQGVPKEYYTTLLHRIYDQRNGNLQAQSALRHVIASLSNNPIPVLPGR